MHVPLTLRGSSTRLIGYFRDRGEAAVCRQVNRGRKARFMKHFYLIWNPRRDGTEAMAEHIRGYLEMRGCTCVVREREEGSHVTHTDPGQVPAETECIITLGGDGTLIRAARDLAPRQLPMVGVNMGHLGYLTQVGCQEPGEVAQMLDELIAGQFQLENRMMLKGTVRRGGEILKEDLALNEILISRREMPKILELRLAVNGEPLCQYKADGMIIATPTGSTAYNLSAGGPIVEPSARMMILTPICPHDLNSRSIVLAAEDTIEIEIMGHDNEGQAVAFDGGAAVRLKVGDRLLVERSRVETVMVKLHEVSFVDNLRSKMAGR